MKNKPPFLSHHITVAHTSLSFLQLESVNFYLTQKIHLQAGRVMAGWHPKGEEGVGGKICYRHSTEGKGGDSCQGEEKPHSGGWFSVNSLLARCSSLFHLRVEEKLVLNKTWVGGMRRKTVSVLLWDWQKHRRTAVEGVGKCKHIWKGAWSKEGKYTESRRTIHRKPPPWAAALLRVEMRSREVTARRWVGTTSAIGGVTQRAISTACLWEAFSVPMTCHKIDDMS